MERARMMAFGRVQGVGFREFVRRIGADCLLSGYVKNLPDGTVEIVAEGEGEKIAEFERRISVRMKGGISVENLEVLRREKTERRNHPSFEIAF